jgi:hypothetical protein
MLMEWLAKWLYRKIRNAQLRDAPEIATSLERDTDPPNMRFAIRKAINGKVIEISSSKVTPNRGHEWTTEYYIVPEDKKVSEALTMLMLLKGADE